jgi:hypothetical protein
VPFTVLLILLPKASYWKEALTPPEMVTSWFLAFQV